MMTSMISKNKRRVSSLKSILVSLHFPKAGGARGLHAQKNLLEVFVAQGIIFAAFKRDAPLFHDVNPVCQFCDLSDVFLDQKDGLA
jgi:hypothetical protein